MSADQFIKSRLRQNCIKKVVDLIKKGNFKGCTQNPFEKFPVTLTNNLIDEVISRSCYDNEKPYPHLFHLLTSSGMRQLVLKDVTLTNDDLENIFKYMLPSSENLDVLQLVNCKTDLGYNKDTHDALQNLIKNSKNLKCIESDIYFDLNSIKDLSNLDTLILHFHFPKSVVESIKAGRLDVIPKNVVKRFKISESESHKACLEISKAALLQCENLTDTNFCLDGALKFLHSEDIRENKVPSTEYKLENLILGKKYSSGKTYASKEAIKLASLTCPNLKSLQIFISDEEEGEILDHVDKGEILGEISNLEKLEIELEFLGTFPGFNNTIKIPTFSQNLKHICLKQVMNFDLSAIGKFCPNLETLNLEDIYGENNYVLGTEEFRCLLDLELIFVDSDLLRSTLKIILKNASGLKSLKLANIRDFNDDMFREVVESNGLNFLTTLHINFTGATEEGILSIKDNFKSFRFEGVALH